MSASSNKRDRQRERLREILSFKGLSEHKVANDIGVAPCDLLPALKATDKSFRAYRYRQRVERYLGELIWTDATEADELRDIGRRLKCDMLTKPTTYIRNMAHTKGVPVATSAGVPGFRLFRALIGHFFPNSATLTLPHYHARPEA